MDSWLAKAYGTGGVAPEAEIEKTAQYMFLQKLAEAEGLDLSQASPQDLDSLYNEVMTQEAQGGQQGAAPQDPNAQQQVDPNAQGAQQTDGQGFDVSQFTPEQLAAVQQYDAFIQQQMAGQQQDPNAIDPSQVDPAMIAQMQAQQGMQQEQQMAKEAQAKFAEADFLGRVMAHAYTQELQKIASEQTKTASTPLGPIGNPGMAGTMTGRVAALKHHAGAAADAVSRGAQAVGSHLSANRGKYLAGVGAAGTVAGRVSGVKAGRETANQEYDEASDSWKSKTAFAIEKLAEMRAGEILTENGIDPSTGQPIQEQQAAQQQQPAQGMQPQQPGMQMPGQAQGQQPQMSDEDQVNQLVEQRAVEMLQQAGYKMR